MKDGTRDEYLFLKPLEDEHLSHTAERALLFLRKEVVRGLPPRRS